VTQGVAVIRGRHYDADLQTDVLKVWGYRASCACGWTGRVKATVAEARRERREHLESEHDGNPTGGEHA
jgi:hypothetical protein